MSASMYSSTSLQTSFKESFTLEAPKGSAEKSGAVLVHGLTTSPQEMEGLAQHLNNSGYLVDVPCLSGHGSTIGELKVTRQEAWHQGDPYRSLQERNCHLVGRQMDSTRSGYGSGARARHCLRLDDGRALRQAVHRKAHYRI